MPVTTICSPRARGANAIMAMKFESAYGVPPAGNYWKLPYVSHSLGEEFGLIEDDLLGTGREGLDPSPDVINNDGDLTVPVDVRAFGYWLMLGLGLPAANSAAAAAASATITLLGQPDNNATITINGVVFTAKTSGASGAAQFNIGSSLADTVANLVAKLSAHTDTALTVATYAQVSGQAKFVITHGTSGLSGNAFTLAAQPAFRAKLPSATLTGGAVKHVFSSGGRCLPYASIEFGHPEIPSYEMNYGVGLNTMRIGLARSGSLVANLGLMGKGSTSSGISGAGTPVDVEIDRFVQARGRIMKDGVQLASINSGSIGFSNGLEKVDSIQPDGRIEGLDPGSFRCSGDIVSLWADNVMDDAAIAREPISLEYGWTFGSFGLTFKLPRVFLPRPKKSVTGPAGIQRTFNWQASGEGAGSMLTAELINDIADHAA